MGRAFTPYRHSHVAIALRSWESLRGGPELGDRELVKLRHGRSTRQLGNAGQVAGLSGLARCNQMQHRAGQLQDCPWRIREEY